MTIDFEAAARDAIQHACYQIANAPLRLYPTPHIYVNPIFPPDFYAMLVKNFPDPNKFRKMQGSDHGNDTINENRYFLSHFEADHTKLPEENAQFWEALFNQISRNIFHETALAKFAHYLDWPRKIVLGSHHDILMISDRSGYDIEPHTDTPQKLFSLLFYCPWDDSHPRIGTSLYWPKNGAAPNPKRTDSWLHLKDFPLQQWADYEKVYTAPYVPNSLFGFVRTRHSFHGVETANTTIPRQLLIYEHFSWLGSRKLREKRKY